MRTFRFTELRLRARVRKKLMLLAESTLTTKDQSRERLRPRSKVCMSARRLRDPTAVWLEILQIRSSKTALTKFRKKTFKLTMRVSHMDASRPASDARSLSVSLQPIGR